MPEGLPAVGSERQRRLLLLGAGRLHDRDQLPRDEGESDEHGRHHNAGHGENDLELVRVEPFTEEALQPEQHHEHQAGNDRRNRKRQIDQRDEKRFATELELGDRPRGGQAKEDIQWHADGRHDEGQADGRQGIRLHHGLAIIHPALRQRLREHVGQRQQQEHEAERHCDADERPLNERRFFRAPLRGPVGRPSLPYREPSHSLKLTRETGSPIVRAG